MRRLGWGFRLPFLVVLMMHVPISPEVDSCSIKFLLLTWWFTDIVISIIRSSKSIIVSENFAAETENVSGFLSTWYMMSQLHRERRWLAVYCVLSDSSAAACWLVSVHISVTSVAICRPLINVTSWLKLTDQTLHAAFMVLWALLDDVQLSPAVMN